MLDTPLQRGSLKSAAPTPPSGQSNLISGAVDLLRVNIETGSDSEQDRFWPQEKLIS